MNSAQLQALKRLAKKKNYGGSRSHARQGMRLALAIHDELARLRMLPKSRNDKAILRSAALLHNTGLPEEPHNKTGFDRLSVEIPAALRAMPLAPKELSTILYCVLWHRGKTFRKRGNIKIKDQAHVRNLAAILRVADGLDRSQTQVVENVSLELIDGRLRFSVAATLNADIEIKRACEKADLMREAYGIDAIDFAVAGSISRG